MSAPVAFARVLRAAGMEVTTGAVAAYVEALDAVGVRSPDALYWSGRATLVHRPEDIPTYDAAFAVFWDRSGRAAVPDESQNEVVEVLRDDEDVPEEGGGDAAPQGRTIEVRWSPTEVLRHQDLATISDDERAELHRLLDRLRFTGARRRGRRRTPGPSGRLDLRRTVARAMRAGGEPLHLEWTEPGERRRRVVLLLDVSGSMAPYARALLRFAHAAVVARAHVEVFALGTRLTRLTRHLATHDPDAALAHATEAVLDWSGGTRLGDTIGEFTDRWGVRGMARGAVVVVLSDGWDRGDAAVLGEHMARLSRVAHRVVWVNPLKATPGYAPLAAGMAAALPHVDQFLEGHSVASLEQLAEVVAC
ncbi:MAG TPA: VWA domain-containing protein [Acidimicrobiales bacterium]|nr:VWA domain-containing protein [Acidimicrobiales bacterium]